VPCRYHENIGAALAMLVLLVLTSIFDGELRF